MTTRAPPRHVLLVLLVLLALLLETGCFRYHTRVPGVLDLRTDASQARKASPEPPGDAALARHGPTGFLLGQGVGVLGSEVHIVERRYSLRGFVPLMGESAAEEIDAAVKLSGALREVRLGEEYSLTDGLISFVGGTVPIASWFMPPYTFEARGVSVRPPRRAVAPPLPQLEPPSLLLQPPTPAEAPPAPPQEGEQP